MLTPMNSLRSFKAGMLCGADIAEIDLSFRKDGTPVIIHAEKPGKNQGKPLSSVFEILAKTPGKKVNLDLKAFWNLPAVFAMLKEYGVADRALFTGVFGDHFETVARDCPGIPYYYNLWFDGSRPDVPDSEFEKAAGLGCVGMNTNHRNVTPDFVRRAREHSLEVSAWTVNDVERMKKLLALGVNNVTTLRPRKLIKLMKSIEHKESDFYEQQAQG